MPRATKKAAAPATPVSVLDDVNKLYPGAMMLGSDPDLEVTRVPTGILPMDVRMDGGVPRGRMIEIFGPYSTLKSYYAYKALAAFQQRGLKVALIDTEHSWDPAWGIELGVDVDSLEVSRPATAEIGFGVMEILVRQKYDLIVFDSIAAAIPKQHQEVAPGEDTHPGALARVMSKGLPRLTAANKHTSIIFINQTREKIGVTFGSPVTTSGGKAMGFYASYRMSFTRLQKITDDHDVWTGKKLEKKKRVLGHVIQATLEKSKLSAPHTDVIFTYDLMTGEVDNVGWLIGQGIEQGIITRTATGHHTIDGVLDKAIHGADKFRTWVEENSEEVVPWLTEQVVPKKVLDSLTA